MTAAILTESLTLSYGGARGILDVDLEVREGEIFGFLGPNGAGKTTTIRVLLDFLRPTSGRASVLGLDSHADTMQIRRRIGFLGTDGVLFGDMTGQAFLDHVAAIRGGVDRARQRELVDRFGAEPGRRITELSFGNRQKIALVAALQHDPELLLLDEPTNGLDPLIQRQFHELLLEYKAAGRTVFLSSHVLSEVERVVDRVAIIREGRIARVATIDELKDLAIRRFELEFAGPIDPAPFATLDGVSDVAADERFLSVATSGDIGALVRLAVEHDLVNLVSREADLEEIFLTFYEESSTPTPSLASQEVR